MYRLGSLEVFPPVRLPLKGTHDRLPPCFRGTLVRARISFHPVLNSEANTKVYDLNQKTMQALGNLAVVYATFEEAGGKPGNREF